MSIFEVMRLEKYFFSGRKKTNLNNLNKTNLNNLE